MGTRSVEPSRTVGTPVPAPCAAVERDTVWAAPRATRDASLSAVGITRTTFAAVATPYWMIRERTLAGRNRYFMPRLRCCAGKEPGDRDPDAKQCTDGFRDALRDIVGYFVHIALAAGVLGGRFVAAHYEYGIGRLTIGAQGTSPAHGWGVATVAPVKRIDMTLRSPHRTSTR
jgi:hypothetical protein